MSCIKWKILSFVEREKTFSIISELILIIVEGFFILHFFNENNFSRQDYRTFLLCILRFNKLELFKNFFFLESFQFFPEIFQSSFTNVFPRTFIHQVSTTIQIAQNIWAFIISMATKIHVIFFASKLNNENIFPCFAVQKDNTSRQFLWKDEKWNKIMNHRLMFAKLESFSKVDNFFLFKLNQKLRNYKKKSIINSYFIKLYDVVRKLKFIFLKILSSLFSSRS